jgi:hypothetical protein
LKRLNFENSRGNRLAHENPSIISPDNDPFSVDWGPCALRHPPDMDDCLLVKALFPENETHSALPFDG